MEVSIFTADLVREHKVKFVEARLHSDTKDTVLGERIAELIETVAHTKAQPTYVVMDPATETEINRFNGMALGGAEEFAGFLKDMVKQLNGAE